MSKDIVSLIAEDSNEGLPKDIVSLIVKDLIEGLPEEHPDSIFVYGGDPLSEEVIDQMRLRNYSVNGPSGGSYLVCLDYVIEKHRTNYRKECQEAINLMRLGTDSSVNYLDHVIRKHGVN